MEEKLLTLEKRIKDTRNIGIIAHIDAGKTTVSEKILIYAAKIFSKTTKSSSGKKSDMHMDYLEMEKERGITIISAVTTFFWERLGRPYRINLIDTPGHVDFTAEVERSLRVLDGAVIVIDGKEGVEPQTETVSRQADKYFVPRIFFINKMDKIEANFDYSLETIKKRLNAKVCQMQIPIGAEKNFRGVIDITELKGYLFDSVKDSKQEKYHEVELSAEQLTVAKKVRSQLLDQVLEFDDERGNLLKKYLQEAETGEIKISATEVRFLVRRACLTGNYFPVFCGSALQNVGVRFLINGVVDFLPNPFEVKGATAFDIKNNSVLVKNEINKPFLGLVFKIITDKHLGKLYFMRIYRGQINVEDRKLYINASYFLREERKPIGERIIKLYEVDAGKRKEITFACAGDIVGVYSPKMNAITGDTISSADDVLLLEKISFPKPLIKRSLHPERVEDKKKVLKVLENISNEDPTFASYIDELNSEIIIQGMGELHLETIVGRLESEFKLKVTCGEPRPEYNERITKKATIEHKIKKQTGGPGSFGFIKITFEPLKKGENERCNFKFISEIKGAQLKNEYILAVKRGVEKEMNKGLLSGYPVFDVKATLHEGAQHPVDSNRDVFQLIGEQAFRKAKEVCKPVIYEPIMKVDVVSGYDKNDNKNILSEIISTLTRKYGSIEESRDDALTKTCYVQALVPLVGMFGYIKELRQATFGRGNFTMVFSHYQQLPQLRQDKLIGFSEQENLKV